MDVSYKSQTTNLGVLNTLHFPAAVGQIMSVELDKVFVRDLLRVEELCVMCPAVYLNFAQTPFLFLVLLFGIVLAGLHYASTMFPWQFGFSCWPIFERTTRHQAFCTRTSSLSSWIQFSKWKVHKFEAEIWQTKIRWVFPVKVTTTRCYDVVCWWLLSREVFLFVMALIIVRITKNKKQKWDIQFHGQSESLHQSSFDKTAQRKHNISNVHSVSVMRGWAWVRVEWQEAIIGVYAGLSDFLGQNVWKCQDVKMSGCHGIGVQHYNLTLPGTTGNECKSRYRDYITSLKKFKKWQKYYLSSKPVTSMCVRHYF